MNVVKKMEIIKLLGIRIKINLLLFPVLLISIFFGYYQQLLIMFLLVVVHEMTHCKVAEYYDISIQEIELFPFGGVVKTVDDIGAEPYKEIIIALAGPASNLFLFSTGYFLMLYFPLKNDVMEIFLISNIVMGGFNLIPILPLDGGRVLRALISYFCGMKQATLLTIIIGKGLSICLLLFGIFMTVTSFENIYIILLAIFLYGSLHRERKMVFFLYFKDVLRKKSKLHEKGIMNSRYLTVLETVDLNKVFQEFSSGKYHFISVISKEGKIMGTLTETEILEALGNAGNHLTIGELISRRK